MKETELEVNDILKALKEIIGEQAQQIAILKATVSALDAENNKVE